MLTCGRRGSHTGVSISNIQEAHPAKIPGLQGPFSGPPLPLLSLLVAFLELGPLWFFVVQCLNITLQYSLSGTVPLQCRAPQPSPAAQLSFSSRSVAARCSVVQCSAVQCSTRLSVCLSLPAQISSKWAAAGTFSRPVRTLSPASRFSPVWSQVFRTLDHPHLLPLGIGMQP